MLNMQIIKLNQSRVEVIGLTLQEILNGESKTIEFKVDIPENSKKYMKTVVGFANSAGGKIIIGVDDKTRELVGIQEDEVFKLMDKVTNAISDSCTPQIIPDVTLQTIEDKTTIVVEIYPGRQRPYYISSEGKEKGVYIRTSGSTRPADAAQIKELEFEGANRYFDQTYAVGYEASPEKIEELCRKMKQVALSACENDDERKTVKDITMRNLLTWGVLIKKENIVLPTNAFVLLTDNDFPQAKIQCAVFKGDTRGTFIDKREYTGSIFEQIEDAYQFVLRNIHLGAKIEGIVRVDSYELPISAIRELIVNAVTHRSYVDEGCVQIAIFDNRLEITSPGMLFGGLTIEEMLEGQSRPRNRAIASAFTAMKIIEHWGSGIPKVMRECRNYGLKEPELIELGVSFRVNVYRNMELMYEHKSLDNQSMKSNTESSKSNIEDSKSYIESLNQTLYKMRMTEKQILNIKTLYESVGSDVVFGRGRVCDILGCAGSTATSLLAKMRSAGIVEAVTGQGKGKYKFK